MFCLLVVFGGSCLILLSLRWGREAGALAFRWLMVCSLAAMVCSLFLLVSLVAMFSDYGHSWTSS